jgi:hypothetical protein
MMEKVSRWALARDRNCKECTVSTSGMIGLAAVAIVVVWFSYRRRREVACTIDLEATQEEFHAHVELEGIEVNEGDEVLVHNAPSGIAIGTRRKMSSRATVHQASIPRRILTRVLGTSHITGLYEVGFEG